MGGGNRVNLGGATPASATDDGPWRPMRAWPVDFAGFSTAEQVIDRIHALTPLVWRGHEDLCWAAWEIDQLTAMLGNADA